MVSGPVAACAASSAAPGVAASSASNARHGAAFERALRQHDLDLGRDRGGDRPA